MPGSLATWLQAKGQSAVSGPEAQLILAVTPVVAVTLAAVFLGEEIAQNAWCAVVLICFSCGVSCTEMRLPLLLHPCLRVSQRRLR